jgi:hypothetical protein
MYTAEERVSGATTSSKVHGRLILLGRLAENGTSELEIPVCKFNLHEKSAAFAWVDIAYSPFDSQHPGCGLWAPGNKAVP